MTLTHKKLSNKSQVCMIFRIFSDLGTMHAHIQNVYDARFAVVMKKDANCTAEKKQDTFAFAGNLNDCMEYVHALAGSDSPEFLSSANSWTSGASTTISGTPTQAQGRKIHAIASLFDLGSEASKWRPSEFFTAKHASWARKRAVQTSRTCAVIG
jgi:hypothetical protein